MQFNTLAALLALVYVFLIEPIDTEKARLENALMQQERLQNSLDKMASEVTRLRSQKPSSQVDRERSLVSILDATSRHFKIKDSISRITPENNDLVRVWLENAGFDAALRWLIDLSSNHTIQVKSISFTREEQPGLINARIELSR
ncbi:MAG: type II secretion system protein GspM [Sedimenticola sp.]